MDQVSFRLEFLHQFLKGQVLVLIGVQSHLTHAAQQLQKTGITRKVGTQDQGVYEKTDQFAHKRRSGDIQIKQKRRSVRQLQEQLKKDPKNEEIANQASLARKDSLDIESVHYKLCVKNYPTDQRMKFEYGQRLLRSKQYDQAIPLFQEARNNPRHRLASLRLVSKSTWDSPLTYPNESGGC